MMINEPHLHHHQEPPPWQLTQPQITTTTTPSSSPPLSPTTISSLHNYLLSTTTDPQLPPPQSTSPTTDIDIDFPIPYPSPDNDNFFIYDFKIRPCTRSRPHDWTDCPFLHPSEKARRRHPLLYSYSSSPCPDFRKGHCKNGDHCPLSHGVFESWLHPTRYRTQPCKDGSGCRRRVCFFAHNPTQLRPGSNHGSTPDDSGSVTDFMTSFRNQQLINKVKSSSMPMAFGSPRSKSGHGSSPGGGTSDNNYYPDDDGTVSIGSGSSVSELMTSFRNLQLNKVKSMPSSWGAGAGGGFQMGSPVVGSPRAGSGLGMRHGFYSLPSTPTRPRVGYLHWEGQKDVCGGGSEEAEMMERVESGREVRVRMFERLSKENPLNGSDPVKESGLDDDFGWVSDLIK